ncbi:MAG: hypothetical protein ABSG25_11380 [Bryobacteraceae bacterium]
MIKRGIFRKNLNIKFDKAIKSSKVRYEVIYNDTITIVILYLDEKRFKGISKVQDGDIYNKKMGEDIAFEKAYEKLRLFLGKCKKKTITAVDYYYYDLISSLPLLINLRLKSKNKRVKNESNT